MTALRALEEKVVNQALLADSLCMNVALGGERSCMLGRHHSEETKQKLRNIQVSQETKAKMSDAAKLQWSNPAIRAKLLAAPQRQAGRKMPRKQKVDRGRQAKTTTVRTSIQAKELLQQIAARQGISISVLLHQLVTQTLGAQCHGSC